MGDGNLLIDRIKTLMGEMSNRRFASKCGISEGAVRNILSGGETSTSTLKKISDECQKPMWWFFSYETCSDQNDFSSLITDEAEGREKLTQAVKNELMTKTSEVLDSDTVYRPALVSNIRAFHYGVEQLRKTDEKIDRLERKIDELMRRFADDDASPEKKRAGNDS